MFQRHENRFTRYDLAFLLEEGMAFSKFFQSSEVKRYLICQDKRIPILLGKGF